MHAMSNTTRRYPRTLQEAFGPYTDNIVFPKPPKPIRTRSPLLVRAFWRVIFFFTGPR